MMNMTTLTETRAGRGDERVTADTRRRGSGAGTVGRRGA
jgi:hypothetical protein